MPWHASLDLALARERGRSVARFRHDGPLRILQTLYPEGDAISHNVLVHPPGGLVGGDVLDVTVQVAGGAHGLVTTPGATRFYRSAGEFAVQRARIRLETGARFEWLPLEAICHSGCLAENRLAFDLAEGAEAMGWDITAFGLPESGEPFEHGSLLQHIELGTAWLERGRIDAADKPLLDGPLGLAGRRCMGSLFFLAGSALARGLERHPRWPCAGGNRGRHVSGAAGHRGARAVAAGRAGHAAAALRPRCLAPDAVAARADAAARVESLTERRWRTVRMGTRARP